MFIVSVFCVKYSVRTSGTVVWLHLFFVVQTLTEFLDKKKILNLLSSFADYKDHMGNWISQTRWLVTVWMVMGASNARVLTTTSSAGSEEILSLLFGRTPTVQITCNLRWPLQHIHDPFLSIISNYIEGICQLMYL